MSERYRLEGLRLLVQTACTIVLAVGALALALAAVLPGWDLPEEWFRPLVLTLLGAILLEAVTERTALMARLRDLTSGKRISGPFNSRTDAYAAAARAIRELHVDNDKDAVLLIASLHGHSGPRHDSRALEEAANRTPEFLAFRDAIWKRLVQGWRVRQLITLTDEERLDALLDRFRQLPNPDRLAVRAYLASDAPSAISLIVAGNQTTLLGVDDDRIYGVGSALMLTGDEVAAWASDHFRELWESAPHRLWQPVTGESPEAVTAARVELRQRTAPAGRGNSKPAGAFEVHNGSKAAYTAANEALRCLLDDRLRDDLEVRLANLHGLSSTRASEGSTRQPWLDEFEQLLDECILVPATGPQIRMIYNIDGPERWEVVKGYLDRWRQAERLEVRGLVLTDAVSLLSPLVIGRSDLLLGVEDDRFYRTGRGVHLHGKHAAEWGQRYFDTLWHDSRVIVLQTPTGRNTDGIATIEQRLVRSSD
jgi:hypothetical protein